MIIAIIHLLIALVLRILILRVGIILGMRLLPARNKRTPFECGFDPKDSSRLPFSLRFFLLAVVFLIFDIEVALLFPLILGIKMEAIQLTFIAGFIFLFILILGLIHEWREGSLRWIL